MPKAQTAGASLRVALPILEVFMATITSYLPVWKDKLKRAKEKIKQELEEAKNNGGRTAEVRARLKMELKIAKDARRVIKQIEQEITQSFKCPCCGCELKLDGDNKCISVVETNKDQ